MSSEMRWIEQTRTEFRKLRNQAERALEQVGDRTFLAEPGPESNSLALIVKHVGGNLRSRWTDVLTTDGEKPNRDRDAEFEIRAGDTRASLMAAWQRGFEAADASLAALGPDDLERPVVIRGETLSIEAAVLRSLTHTSGHVGQIVWLAKYFSGERWQTLSIPRGQSAQWRP
jgi:hypothetical protein